MRRYAYERWANKRPHYLLLSLHLLPRYCFSVLDVDVISLHLLQQSRFHEELRGRPKTVI